MKKKKQAVVRYEPAGLSRLEERINELEANSRKDNAEIFKLQKQVNILSQALRMSHDRTSHVINEFGLDVPERLRPRR